MSNHIPSSDVPTTSEPAHSVRITRWQKVVGALGLLVLLGPGLGLFGPGSAGPNGHGGPDSTVGPTSEATSDQDPDSGVHQPPDRFDH